MITPSFSPTATERVLPKLALDFTTASLDSRVTFTRAGNTATVTNSSGNIVGINADLPRFDYDSITLACKGLLIEESRTNQFTYSNDFSQAIWQKVGLTLSAGFVTSPDGTNNMVQLIENAGSGTKFITQTALGTTGAQTVSIFAKYAGRQYLWISLSNSATGFYFDLQNGTTTQFGAGSETATMTLLKNGIYRCTITRTQIITDKLYFGLSASTATFVYTGDGVSGAYVYGIQQEADSFATSYIPTTSAALTRNADVATMTGSNFTSWFNQSEGAFVANVQSNGGGAAQWIFQVANNAYSEFLNLDCRAVFANTDSSAVLSRAYTIPGKVSAAYKLNNFGLAANGVNNSTSDTSCTVGGPFTQLIIGHLNAGSYYLNGCLKGINYYPQRLTQSELIAFSK